LVSRNRILGWRGHVGTLLNGLEPGGAFSRFLLSPLPCLELRLTTSFGGGPLYLGTLLGFGFLALPLVLSFNGFLYPLPCLFASLRARRREIPVLRAVQIRPRI
jgi:hypothetical protein